MFDKRWFFSGLSSAQASHPRQYGGWDLCRLRRNGEMKEMFLDEKNFDRLLERVEACVHKVLTEHGIKPGSAESKDDGPK
jgi:hypothetical protein